MISVPKKRLRHAVDRVTMRRRIREAYRLARPLFPMPPGTRIDLAFTYVADKLRDYASIEHAMHKLLAKIQQSARQAAEPQDTPTEP